MYYLYPRAGAALLVGKLQTLNKAAEYQHQAARHSRAQARILGPELRSKKNFKQQVSTQSVCGNLLIYLIFHLSTCGLALVTVRL